MKINCIIIDDEYPAIQQMEEYVGMVPSLHLVGSFDNAIASLPLLKTSQIDLIFLDIEMEGFTGLQLIKSLRHRPMIVFTTAYDQHALEAFNLNVTDYLLKPISFDRFIQAIDKVFDQVRKPEEIQVIHPSRPVDYFFIKTEFRMQRIDFDDVLFIEGMKEYLRIHARTERFMTLQNFSGLERQLPKDRFLRVHRSYVVALNKIERYEKGKIKIGDYLIPLSETYREEFLHFLKHREKGN